MKRRVLIVLNSAEQLGGTEKHVENLIKGLSNEFDFTVCCKNGPFVSNYQQAGASYIELYPKFEFDLTYIFRLIRLIRIIRPIVIHAHQLKAGSLGTIAGFFGRVPVRIYHEHTPIWQWPLPKWKKYTTFWLNWFVNFAVGNFFATHVIALTQEIKKERIKKELISSKKIVIIPNGVNTKEFKVQGSRFKVREEWGVGEKDFVIGNISRLSEEKGHVVLLKAFSRLLSNYTNYSNFPNYTNNIHLIIAGEGVLKEKLKILAQELKIEKQVKFLGNFKEEDKFKILSGFDLFVFPSFAEGFGIVLVEAMLAGLNVISSDLPVLKEVGGSTVTYFKKGNVESLASTIEDYLKMPKGFNQNAIERVEKLYSMDRFVESYRKLYQLKSII